MCKIRAKSTRLVLDKYMAGVLYFIYQTYTDRQADQEIDEMSGYENEVKTAIEELKESFELGRSFNPAYTKSQFVATLSQELRKIDLKVNEIVRSGGHPSDDLRVQRFAHKNLISELMTSN